MKRYNSIFISLLLILSFSVSTSAKGLVITILPDNDTSEERTLDAITDIDNSVQEVFDDISLFALSIGLGVNVIIFIEMGMKGIHSTLETIKDQISYNHLGVDDLKTLISSGFRGSYGSVGFKMEF